MYPHIACSHIKTKAKLPFGRLIFRVDIILRVAFLVSRIFAITMKNVYERNQKKGVELYDASFGTQTLRVDIILRILITTREKSRPKNIFNTNLL